MKGAFIDSLGRDYYKIGTAADIQVILVHPWIGLDTVIFVLCVFMTSYVICHMTYIRHVYQHNFTPNKSTPLATVRSLGGL